MDDKKYHDWSVIEDPRFDGLYSKPDAGLKDMYDLLDKLTSVPSTPGFEQGIALELVKMMKPLCDEVQVDHAGNVYGKKAGHEDGPVIMCPAHSDCVGFMTESVEPSGYVRFTPMGMIPSFLAYGERVLIITKNGPVTGVVGTMPGHSLNIFGDADGRQDKACHIPAPVYDNMYIDIGAGSLDEALEMGVGPGQQIVYERPLRWLGDGSSGVVTGAGLDDKAGLVVLIEALKLLKGKEIYPTVYMVGAATEELGCRGAGIAGNYLNADMCIGVDGSVSEAGPETGSGKGIGTPPNVTKSELPASVGGGVGIAINDIIMTSFAGLFGNQRINSKLVRLARELDIPYQIEAQAQYVTSDPTAVQGTGFGGTPSVTLKLPMRYTHGPLETVSLYDMKACAQLLAAFIEDLSPETFDLKFVDIPEADGGCGKNRTGIK